MTKGSSLSIQTIVILALAIIVLITLTLFYTGQVRGLFGAVGNIGSTGVDESSGAASQIGDVIDKFTSGGT